MVVHTSDIPGAGTGGGVWVDLEGLVASSGPQDLPSAPLAFERGQVSITLSGSFQPACNAQQPHIRPTEAVVHQCVKMCKLILACS